MMPTAKLYTLLCKANKRSLSVSNYLQIDRAGHKATSANFQHVGFTSPACCLQILLLLLLFVSVGQSEDGKVCAVGGRQRICVPKDYQKYDLPEHGATTVTIGVDIKDIPKVSDRDFSITINAYFNVKWRDPRLEVSKVEEKGKKHKASSVSSFFYIYQTSEILLKTICSLQNLKFKY